MSDIESLDLLIEGGKAKPGPATAPRLGALKINMSQLFQDINDKTKDYSGMNVPVKVLINKKDRSYKIVVGTPPVSSLLRKELGLKKIAPEKKTEGAASKPEEKKEEKSKEPKKEEKTKEAAVPSKKVPKEKVIREIIADVTVQQCIKVAKMKRASLLSKTFKKAVKEVVGSCASMPVTVEGKTPKEVLQEIEQGKYDSLLKDQ
ncbi:MAG: hypothetical protein AUJ50_05375 [Candidatus Aenigmarchaeota archaeon CG1_02_38_14]|nr:MAG: hypothetical protein AUJ50_05375 [Candidatus Aenigmarchaeota archaeon CG1_02_38_14]